MITENIYTELVKFRGNSVRCKEGPTEMITYLEKAGYIRTTASGVFPELTIRSIQWDITVHGETALSEFEAYRDQQAKEERQCRFDNKISVLGLLVPLITFVLGLVVEHFAGIVGILLQSLG